MREILFRGKRKDNGEWVYGHHVTYDRSAYIFEQNEVDRGLDIGGWLDCCRMTEVIPETVGQFTGLVDMNGKKIFEGDIVNAEHYYAVIKHIPVRWYARSCGFEPFSDSIENCGHCGGGLVPENCEVLGNIHDNPELLINHTEA